MPSSLLPLLGESDFPIDLVWLLVMVLIGLGSLIKGIVQKMNQEKRRPGARQTPAPPPLADRVRSEIRKYLGELDEPKRPEPKPEIRPTPAPAPPAPVPLMRPPPPPPAAPAPQKRVRRIPERKPRRPAERRPAVPAWGGPFLRPDRPEDLRRAILAREILGPPVALRMRRGASRLTRR
jgi:hypothetical protein